MINKMSNLRFLGCSVFLKALRHFAHTIQDKFSSPFEIEVSMGPQKFLVLNFSVGLRRPERRVTISHLF